MVGKTDYENRRRDVLKVTIELYLDTAQPVGSEMLLHRYSFNLSSSSIRHVLKELEDLGYLTHPHTSAGRIPTDLGYRFYINNLMSQTSLSEEEASTLNNFFNFYLSANREVFDNVSRMLSDFTHYVGIATSEDKHGIFYRGLSYLLEQPEFQDIDTVHSLFKALEEDRLFELMRREMNKPIEVMIGNECSCFEIDDCALVVSRCYASGKERGRLAILGPKRMAYKRVIPMINYLSELVVEEID